MGRFEEDKTADNVSALFHLKTGADCGLSIAEFTLGESTSNLLVLDDSVMYKVTNYYSFKIFKLRLQNYEFTNNIRTYKNNGRNLKNTDDSLQSLHRFLICPYLHIFGNTLMMINAFVTSNSSCSEVNAF